MDHSVELAFTVIISSIISGIIAFTLTLLFHKVKDARARKAEAVKVAAIKADKARKEAQAVAQREARRAEAAKTRKLMRFH